ncbi:hypothetical protein [Vogesella indigofera]|uniref:hypothetical protein n=1 Tax=Vogesella indigofera TaxID=45465 RepID=UPI00234EEF09|nr:hypothetical protein [Vogesella indigofera]MDC7711182.1 hypothetical protein [Vogesella indigofera]
MKSVLLIYILYCSVIAFVDIDWDAKDERSAYASLVKQTLYMNKQQKFVYLDDLEVIQQNGKMGGARGVFINRMEAHEIHYLANELRKKSGVSEIEFPEKTLVEYVVNFLFIPIAIMKTI